MNCYCDACFTAQQARYDRAQRALYVVGAVIVAFWVVVFACLALSDSAQPRSPAERTEQP